LLRKIQEEKIIVQTRLAPARPYRLPGFLILSIAVLLLCASVTAAQTTLFSYQGKLTDGGNPANGAYDFQFKLFDTATVGTGAEHGPVLTAPNWQVTSGIFTIGLDFGSSVFTGENRFLEIGVRPAGSANPYTLLSPRQLLTSSPYAIQTLNATQLGGVDASNFIHANANGDVGINAPVPTAKLDVGGIIQSKLGINNGQFRIGGTSVLSAISGNLLSINEGGFSSVSINGNVGIGTPNPTSKLEIAAQDGLKITGFQPFLTLNDTNTNLRSIIAGGNGDFGFYPHSFIGGIPAVLIKNNSGNVGIGTTSPQAKLQIGGVGTNGYTLGVEGNVTQNLNKFGFAKAMLHVDQLGTIDRCFNSTVAGNDMTVSPCGFSVSMLETGIYTIDFRFPTLDRFVTVTAGAHDFTTLVPAIAYGDGNGGGPNLITVKIRETSTGAFKMSSFTIIVF